MLFYTVQLDIYIWFCYMVNAQPIICVTCFNTGVVLHVLCKHCRITIIIDVVKK